jgi:hypothetical protein
VLASENRLTFKAHDNFKAVAEILGQNHEWIDSFIAGFDNGYITYGEEPVEEAYEMGKRLRTEMSPIIYYDFIRDIENDQY